MTAQEAYDYLDPQAWAQTSAVERLTLIEEIQSNLKRYIKELGAADIAMKNGFLGAEVYSPGMGIAGTASPIANMLMGAHHLCEALANGDMLHPVEVKQVDNEVTAVQTWPIFKKDKILAGKQKGYLYVKGEPQQINALEKPAGVIAISGAGNYSSSVEMVKALFFENKAVIHKPHQNNVASDRIWAKVFQPLIDRRALVFIEPEEARAMTTLEGLHAVYFTGSTGVAHAIQKAAKSPLVAECGGNNPLLIVPGRTWTAKEIRHQALQVATLGKLNGGAVCGRVQTIVTSKNWPQRQEFLDALRKAIAEETFANGAYYPGVDQTRADFIAHHSQAEILEPEAGKYPHTDFVLIPDLKAEDYGIDHEAFCQIISEIALDTDNDADDYLTKATTFANEKLLGTLGCMILVDNDTFKAQEPRVMQAVNELNYGGIAVNTIPPNIFLSAYMTWGGCNERHEDFVSGVGNFGNAHNYENVIKSVLVDDFHAQGLAMTNKKNMDHLLTNSAYFMIDNSWRHFAKLAGQMAIDSFRKKDF